MDKKDMDIQKTKDDLMEAYKKHLDEIFSDENFKLTFDQRERLIDEKLKKETTEIIEKHIEKDPKGVSHSPAETCLCPCGTEAVLCKDSEGDPIVYERQLKTKNGPVTVKEYGYYCSTDRKFFFLTEKHCSSLKKTTVPTFYIK